MDGIQSVFACLVLALLAWLCSENKRRIDVRAVACGLLLQYLLAAVLIKIPVLSRFMGGLNDVVDILEQATRAGASFAFGYLGGGPAPFAVLDTGATYVLAFRGLLLLLTIGALTSLFFYWRILPWIVRWFSLLLRRTLGIGGALGVAAAANVFLGMVESPMLIRPYLGSMTRSEMFSMMTVGMSTIAGTVLVLYASILAPALPGALGHILLASLLSVPAALLLSRLMVPETGLPTAGEAIPPQEAQGMFDAIVKGTQQGIALYIPILGLLIVLVALVTLVNLGLAWLPEFAGAPLTLQRILGLIMAPVVWLIGVPWAEAATAGSLMGVKTVLNELLAYLELSRLPAGALSPRSSIIMTYALCGFANFGSLGIMIGGLGALAPERRSEIVQLGPRSLLSGTLATLMTGAVAGAFY